MGSHRTVHFNVYGEFITRLVREQFFYNNIGYEKTMELLLSCMEGTERSEKQLARLAEDVILGRAALAGNTADKTYHMEIYDPDEQPEVPDCFNVFKVIARLKGELEGTKKELRKMEEWYAVAMEHVPEYRYNDVLLETGQISESSSKNKCFGNSDFGNSLLNSYMERMMDEEEHSSEDYGWLEPDGTFHEVEWAKHQSWAEQFIRENMNEEEWLAAGIHLDGQFKTAGYNSFGDYLIDRGWVLLHSPSQGIAQPTRNPVKRYTKAQQEFLYEYYMERDKEKEANAVYKDSEY